MIETSPFHPGELAVQSRLGVREQVAPIGAKLIRNAMPTQHAEFFAAQPFIVAAARDQAGRPWATALTGEAGFITSPQPDRLAIAALPAGDDPLADALHDGADVGLIGIEFATRRRNRMNGRVSARHAGGIELQVGQSFGNCPRFLTPRAWRRAPNDAPARPVAREDVVLGADLQALIERADTFFIASGYRGPGDERSFGMDASHRGGEPGFIEVHADNHLVFPDYNGNRLYNTMGNLELDDRIGLAFMDFDSGSLLQLTGTTKIEWDGAEVASRADAARLVHVLIDAVVYRENVLPLRWD